MNSSGSVCMNETQHLAKVGEAMRDARLRGDRRGADVEIVCDEHRDLVHFHLAAAHSDLIRRTIDARPLPFKIVMSGCKPQALTQVIDWMYTGKLQFPLQSVGDYLAITAVLSIEQLHSQLENVLMQLATLPEQRVACLNIAADPRYKITTVTLTEILSLFGKDHEGLSTKDIEGLNHNAIQALVACPSIPFADKIDIINIAILWLNTPNRATHLGSVLDAIRIEFVKPTALNLFISTLKRQFEARDAVARNSLHAYSKDGCNVELSCDALHLKRSSSVGPLSQEIRSPRTPRSPMTDAEELSRLRDLGASDKFISTTFGSLSHQAAGTDRSRGSSDSRHSSGAQLGALIQPQPGSRTRNKHQYCHCDESVAEIIDLPSAFDASSRTRRKHDYDHCDESMAEISVLPNTFASVEMSPKSQRYERDGSPGNRTENRYGLSPDSIADIGELPAYFTDKAGPHGRTINRYATSQESVAEIQELPVYFIPEDGLDVDMTGRTMRRHELCQESMAEISALPSFFELQEVAARCAEANKENPKPGRADEVIGKKLMTKEELDDLKKIPGICSPPASTADTQANGSTSSSSVALLKTAPEISGGRPC